MGFIYMFTSPSNKSYIGQTTRTIEIRRKEHVIDATKYKNGIKPMDV